MKNFTRGKGNFDRRDSGRGNFRRDNSDRPKMYNATCAECGSSCEVPFKPMNGKPVFCSSCFGGKEESAPRSFRGRDEYRHEEKKMFRATCSECGKSCEVPFKPNSDKPVYCDQCFGRTGSEKGNKHSVSTKAGSNDQFEILNKKLDQILQALNSSSFKKSKVVKEIIEDVEDAVEDFGEEVEEIIAKPKKAAKKAVAKVEKAIKKIPASLAKRGETAKKAPVKKAPTKKAPVKKTKK